MDNFTPLIKSSIQTPAEAARTILNMRLGRDVLWTALALVAVLNTFLITVVVELSGPTIWLPGYADRPLAMFILIAGMMVVYIHSMYWAGLAMGGKGALMDVLAVVVWFQVLRAMAQLAIVLVSFLVPSAGLLLSLVVAIWGLWILLNFLSTALNLATLWHGIAVLVVAFIGLVLGLGVLMALIGGVAQGVLG